MIEKINMRKNCGVSCQSDFVYRGHRLREYVQYIREYPDVFDRILSLWNSFDLDGLRSFFMHLDLEVPYARTQLSHKRYIQNRDSIINIIRSENNYPNIIPDRNYLDGNRVKEVYSSNANEYDKIWDNVWTYEDRERVIRELQLAPSERLLEVGIGTGNNLKHFPKDCYVTGIDFSIANLAICKKKAKELSLNNLRLFERDAHNLTFEDASFDKVLCFYTLCCVEDPFKVLEELSRVCVSGGTLVVYDVVRSDIPEVALAQYLYRPIAKELGAIYLEFCPPNNISYDSYFDIHGPAHEAGFKERKVYFLDPFRTVVLGVYENR